MIVSDTEKGRKESINDLLFVLDKKYPPPLAYDRGFNKRRGWEELGTLWRGILTQPKYGWYEFLSILDKEYKAKKK